MQYWKDRQGLFPLCQWDGLPSHLVSTWRIKPESLPLSVFVRVSVCILGGLQSHVCSQLTVSRRCFFGGGTCWDCIDRTVSPCHGDEKEGETAKRKRDADRDWIVHEKTFLCSFVGFLKNWKTLETQRGIMHLFLSLVARRDKTWSKKSL